nr:hypothetical protein [Prevotella sp. LMAG:51]
MSDRSRVPCLDTMLPTFAISPAGTLPSSIIREYPRITVRGVRNSCVMLVKKLILISSI